MPKNLLIVIAATLLGPVTAVAEWSVGVDTALRQFSYAEQENSVSFESVLPTLGAEIKNNVPDSAHIWQLGLRGSFGSVSCYEAEAMFGYALAKISAADKAYVPKIYLGWQSWGMSVPNNEYGIKNASGLQLGLSIEPEHSKNWGITASVAPISNAGFDLKSTSYKFKLGTTYRLNSGFIQRPLDIILGVEKVSISLQQNTNQVDAQSVIAGMRWNF